MRLSGSFLSTQQLLRDAPASLSPRRPQLSIATAIVFYHRFFARESYANYDKFQVPCYSRTAAAAAPPFAARRCSHGSIRPACARVRATTIGVGHGSCCLSLPPSLCRSRRPASSSPPRLRKHPRSSRTLYSSAIRCSTIQCSRPSRTPPSCGTSRRRSSSARGSYYASSALI